MEKNYYEILGIDRNANSTQIRKAYRAMQLKYHPDKNNKDNETYYTDIVTTLNNAYETLSDEKLRAEYDSKTFGTNNPKNINLDVPDGMDEIITFFMNKFSPMMQKLNKPPPIILSISLDLEDVLNNILQPFEIERWIYDESTKEKIKEKATIYVKIPMGVDHEEIIIEKDKGNVLSENNKGDVKIIVNIKPNPLFKRDGLNLIYHHTVTLKESLCGFSFELNHLNGKKYNISTQSGCMVKPNYCQTYNDMGITRDNITGKLIITFDIIYPDKLTDEQIQQLNIIL